ncbi:VP39 [Operophtera brumata nucleopolyhedrovirus]|uniref:VP39 n=1 Tax=Operophtera brumata nucleopolyhedrovirus TaxID=1046267 RepID=A0A2H4UZW5_9ABAC|nr:VP39 [Operophtera brumata nucleopolyhedrovirus]AUA60305.1 VP39 [Operophtera brumata nucleopolyhedrovirus]
MLQFQTSQNGNFTGQTTTNNCVFKTVHTFDRFGARLNRPECSPDAYNMDETYVCNFHLSYYFRTEKSTITIPDAKGQELPILAGRSLIQQDDDQRIVIPLKQNYKEILSIDNMPLEERLVFYLIYKEDAEVRRICDQFKGNMQMKWDHINAIYTETSGVIAKSDPNAICISVSTRSTRSFTPDAQVVLDNPDITPPFIGNLIRKLVAPQDLNLGGTSSTLFILRTSPTVAIEPTGLRVLKMYNEIDPTYDNTRSVQRVVVTRDIVFSDELIRSRRPLAKYDKYPIHIQFFLGSETM